MEMELPKRKSHTLERAILKFNEDLEELRANHKQISDKILGLSSNLLTTQDKIEAAKGLEDLNYEMENNILLNMEMIFETIGGFELTLIDIEPYIPSIKEEHELLKDLELSAKNLIKTMSVTDDALGKQERDNFNFLYDSYKKLAHKTQHNLKEIHKTLNEQFQKVKKMEKV